MTVVLAGAACSSGDGDDAAAGSASIDGAPVTLSGVPFDEGRCGEGFVPHDLDHQTTPRGDVVAMLDGTGSGALAEDLDGDGWIDLVFPNLSGETSILWNDGPSEADDDASPVTFDRQPLDTGRFRQAVTADLDADGDLDLVLTTGVGPPVAYLQQATTDGEGRPGFERAELGGVRSVAFSIAPGDLDGDGDIDIVTSSYNAELTANRDSRALLGVDVGTAIHRLGDDGDWATEQLADSAQALVSQIVDLDGDGREDIVVGNDLGTPDRVWLGGPGGSLVPSQVFSETTLSTMSIDVGDLDNDGDHDLVATDMKPMDDDPDTLDAWEPVMDDIDAASVDDVQVPENVLQLADDDGYQNVAGDYGIEATGWSWSGLLGDLDNDGFQDLYVVNGMQAVGIFDHLPEAELVEPNQAFRNTGSGLAPAPEWNLADTAGGRGMTQADLDRDGDLDIVINNIGAPARLFENRLCDHRAVIVDLTWDGVANRTALGAAVTVSDDDGSYLRLVTGSRGYLSTSPSEAHIGLGDEDGTVTVEIDWPDGETTTLSDVGLDQRLVVTRTGGVDS